MFGISPLSLAVSGIYIVVAVLTAVAGMVAGQRRQPAWHRRAWLLLAILFALLVAMRLLNVEELLRENLRELLRVDAAYDNRRDFQQPLAAAVVGLGGLAGLMLFAWVLRKLPGRRNLAVLAGLAAGAGMLTLVALRLISLHAVDAWLYGPLKLNWVADVGFCLVTAVAAGWYIRRLGAREMTRPA